MFGLIISFDRLLLLFIESLTTFVVFNKPCEDVSHEFIVLLDELFLFELLTIPFETTRVDLLLAHTLKNALHVLIIVRQGKLAQRDCLEFVAGTHLERVLGVIFDHLVEILQVGNGLQILEAEFGFLPRHNKNIKQSFRCITIKTTDHSIVRVNSSR